MTYGCYDFHDFHDWQNWHDFHDFHDWHKCHVCQCCVLIIVYQCINCINSPYFQVFLDHRPKEEVSKLVAAKTNGATPLVLSCRNGHQEVVEYLVDRCSASVEQPGSVTFDGETIEGAPPLWCAAAAGSILTSISSWLRSLQLQSRRLNTVAYTLPCGVHMYAPAYTLCPVQGIAR